MEDLTGIGKILDSKTVEKVYDDAISPAAQEIGQVGKDIVKGLRLFTAPFQLAAVAHDRLVNMLDQVRSRVPEQRHVHAPANIAGPVLLNLRFEDDESAIKEMYLNLLTAAIDEDRQWLAHPAFVKIIEQLSPDEAWVLLQLSEVDLVRLYTVQDGTHKFCTVLKDSNRVDDISLLPDSHSQQLQVIIDHLIGLGLVEILPRDYGLPAAESEDVRTCEIPILVNQFGRALLRVCIDEETRELVREQSYDRFGDLFN